MVDGATNRVVKQTSDLMTSVMYPTPGAGTPSCPSGEVSVTLDRWHLVSYIREPRERK